MHEEASEECDPDLINHISAAIADRQPKVRLLASGAGHDAMVMSHVTAVGLIFVRCSGGISHNPAESITLEDAALGADVLMQSVLNFATATT